MRATRPGDLCTRLIQLFYKMTTFQLSLLITFFLINEDAGEPHNNDNITIALGETAQNEDV